MLLLLMRLSDCKEQQKLEEVQLQATPSLHSVSWDLQPTETQEDTKSIG